LDGGIVIQIPSPRVALLLLLPPLRLQSIVTINFLISIAAIVVAVSCQGTFDCWMALHETELMGNDSTSIGSCIQKFTDIIIMLLRCGGRNDRMRRNENEPAAA